MSDSEPDSGAPERTDDSVDDAPAAPKQVPVETSRATPKTLKTSLIDVGAFDEVKQCVSSMQVKAQETFKVAKDPVLLKQKLQALLPERLFFIFFMIWFPFLVIAAGSASGFLIQLFTRNIHFLLGLAAGFYVYKFVHAEHHSHQEKTRVAMLVSSILPFILIEDAGFFVQLIALLAFCGTPFLLTEHFAPKVKTDEVTEKSEEFQNVLLMYSIAPAVTFAIAAGGTSYVNAVFLIICFVTGMFAAENLLPFIQRPQIPPIVKQIPELVFITLEVLIAQFVLLILQWLIIPEGVQNEENPIWASLIYIILGIGIVAGGEVLQGKLPNVKLDDNLRINGKRGITYAVIASYVVLLLAYLGKHGLLVLLAS